MAVQFFLEKQNIALKHRTALKHFIKSIFDREKKNLSDLTYVFCSDDYLLAINKTHLRHDYYTDIITFDLSDRQGEISGEIYISTDSVRDNAATQVVSINEELHRVIFHGALHLCGYKDKTVSQKEEMRVLEDKYLRLYFKQRST